MADNAFIKIGTALLKHQVKKLVGEETLGVISDELADIGGDKLDAWLGDKSTIAEIEKAATTARDNFRGKVNDDEVEQWMVMLPIHDLPAVLSAIEELPTSPDETKLENALRETIALNWKRLSSEQVDNAVNSFLTCLRSALLPIEKQTLMVIGRSVLRTEDKVDLLVRWFEQYIITGKSIEIKHLNPEPVETWNLKHPYAMPPNFTGRVEERKILVDWLNNDKENRLFILRALGGFGKSALSWHWLTHDVDSKEWKKVLWWSFYEGDASFEHFIEETLKYLKLEVPQGQRPQVDELLKAMQSQKILLIMDGFERALRAYSSMNAAYQGDEEPKLEDSQYDCVNINAEIFLKSVCALPNIKSKALMTTRLTPRTVKPRGELLQGCREKELKEMDKADALAFFHAQGIKGTHAEIETACAPYGYHPLSLRILAGLINEDRETPSDIAVAKNIDITDDIIQNKHHILEVAYNTLSLEQQKLLSNIACFRFSIEYKALKIVFSIPSRKRRKTSYIENLSGSLKILETRGLLQWDRKANKYNLHPIVQHYAYKRLSAPDRTATHARLRDYFSSAHVSEEPENLEELALIIELYYHTVLTGDLDEAIELFGHRLQNFLYYKLGAYSTIIELLEMLFLDDIKNFSRLTSESWQAWALNSLAISYSMLGLPQLSIPLLQKNIEIREKRISVDKNKPALGNLAIQQISTGLLQAAELNIRRDIQIEYDLDVVKLFNKYTHPELGRLFSTLGLFDNAKNELNLAWQNHELLHQTQIQSLVSAYQSLNALLALRSSNEKSNIESAIMYAKRSLDLANEQAKDYPVKSDFVRSYWLLGSSYRLERQLDLAGQYLSEALTRNRAINMVDHEADILLDLARLHYDLKKYGEAKSLAEEALSITKRSGYVLQGADVNLFLAQYALEQEQDKAKAKQYAEEAKKLATCDGPPYYYKVAYEEAERMLENL